MRVDVCRIRDAFARTLNGHPPRTRFACVRPLRFSKGAWDDRLACYCCRSQRNTPHSSPGATTTPVTGFSAAFRPSSQTSSMASGGHRRGAVCWRLRDSRPRPDCIIRLCFLRRLKVRCTLSVSTRRCFVLVGVAPMAVGSSPSCCFITSVVVLSSVFLNWGVV